MILNPASSSKSVVKHKDENAFEGFKNFFDPENNDDNKYYPILKNKTYMKFYDSKKDIFYCKQKNKINNKVCYVYNELCKRCLLINQAYHKLKPHYLINAAGRVCTFRKGKMFCLGTFQRVYSENKIDFLIDCTCNGKIQCEPCKRMEENIEKYYGENLYNAIKKRDEKLGY